MKHWYWLFLIAAAGILLALSVVPASPLYGVNWALVSAVIVGLAVLSFFLQFEKTGANTKEVAVIATMASLAAVVRIPFAALMSFQPTTFIVMITGYVFGPRSGFMVGATAALVSNFFVGQGPWTPWQMFAWGACGATTGLVGGRVKDFKLFPLLGLSLVWGLLYGWIMNIWHWVGFIYPLNMKTFLATYAASIPYDALHAAGNIAFALLLGRSCYNILHRFKKKMYVTYVNAE